MDEFHQSWSKSDSGQQQQVPAPLATPENLDIGVEYMTVKDALNRSTDFSSEDDPSYATLDSINQDLSRPLPPPKPPKMGGKDIPPSSQLQQPPAQAPFTQEIQLSSSERDSSLEKGGGERSPSPYEKTGRKPTPHRRAKKHRTPGENAENAAQSQNGQKATVSGVGPGIAERLRQLNTEFTPIAPPGSQPPTFALWPSTSGANETAPTYVNSRALPLQLHRHFRLASPTRTTGLYAPHRQEKEQRSAARRRKVAPAFLVRFKSASEESLLDPFNRHYVNVGEVEPGEESTNQEEGRSFMRKMASSFRFKKKKGAAPPLGATAEEAEGSKSVPQSPLLPRTPLSPANRRQGPVEGGVFVLPPFQTWNTDVDSLFETGITAQSQQTQEHSRKLQLLCAPSGGASQMASGNKSPRKEVKSSWKNRKTSNNIMEQAATRKKSSSGSLNLMPPGATLKDLWGPGNDPVPVFVRKCVEFIEKESGLTLEGLYRVPGNQAQVGNLEQKFSENPQVDFGQLDVPVNAVATSLKNFFSYLADPVIPFSLYDDVVRALEAGGGRVDPEKRLDSVRGVLLRLPPQNRDVLRFFIGHLRKVAQHAHVNSMDLRNLAKCWWPTLLRPHFDSFESMAQLTPRLEEFAYLLFENVDRLL